MLRRLPFSRGEWLRLSGFGGAVLFLHLLGWGLFLWYARSNAALAGLGTLAYTFGLRHAFDADHIAAIDNTTRKFLQEDRRPLGLGKTGEPGERDHPRHLARPLYAAPSQGEFGSLFIAG